MDELRQLLKDENSDGIVVYLLKVFLSADIVSVETAKNEMLLFAINNFVKIDSQAKKLKEYLPDMDTMSKDSTFARILITLTKDETLRFGNSLYNEWINTNAWRYN